MHHRHQHPPEICNLARLNRAFRGAASSDSVWEAKLPRNYQDLLDLFPSERHRNLSKKDIFALLSRPLPFDDGHKVGGALQCGWTESREGFACRFRQGRWRLLELMTGDIGIGFLLKNLELSSPEKFSTGDVPNRTNELYNSPPKNLSLPEKWSSPKKLRASRDSGDYLAMVESNPQW
ncbi:hypothetical protein VIGAN_09104800 [Vigna angularis var. angularis]|uniref:F-box domain-containing protein n=1 Tax=Vigna angularis var. angularis TaxID=157739 RepID=A0A0S3SXM6_PHAAN|nr:hypothetical protein VIGAN_09104800 [Vigna angularis var. angularis]